MVSVRRCESAVSAPAPACVSALMSRPQSSRRHRPTSLEMTSSSRPLQKRGTASPERGQIAADYQRPGHTAWDRPIRRGPEARAARCRAWARREGMRRGVRITVPTAPAVPGPARHVSRGPGRARCMLLAGAAGFGAQAAVLVRAGRCGAFVGAGFAGGGARGEDRAGDVGAVAGVRGQHGRGGVAQVRAVHVGADAPGELTDHALGQAGVRTRRTRPGAGDAWRCFPLYSGRASRGRPGPDRPGRWRACPWPCSYPSPPQERCRSGGPGGRVPTSAGPCRVGRTR